MCYPSNLIKTSFKCLQEEAHQGAQVIYPFCKSSAHLGIIMNQIEENQ
jgi:hypothetical protein